MTRRLLALLVVALLSFACFNAPGFKKDVETKAVPRFHEQFNANKFDDIYREATDRFRDSAKKSDYDAFMSALRRKLGRANSSTMQGQQLFAGTNGTILTLTYETKFEHGTGVETFRFIKTGSGPKLLGYHVNSNALITQ